MTEVRNVKKSKVTVEARNIRTVRAYNKRFNAHDIEGMEKFKAGKSRSLGTRVEPFDKEQVRQYFEGLYSAFPDAKMEILRVVAQGNYVMLNCVFTGTHKGKFEIPGVKVKVLEPTDRAIAVSCSRTFRFDNRGMILEVLNVSDWMQLEEQLGFR